MKNLILVFVIVSFLASCRKSDNLSDIPHITFVSLTAIKDTSLKDIAAVISVDYEDGDGDLGKLESDTNIAYRNLFMKYFQKKNGVWFEPVVDPPYDSWFKTITPKAKDKSILGNISYKIDLLLPATNDTIKLSVYIVDRANHKSNTIETSELVITTR